MSITAYSSSFDSSFLVFQFLTVGMGQILVQAEDFRKKFRSYAYLAFACAVKAREIQGFKVQVGSFKK